MNAKEIVYWKQKDGKLVSIDDMDTNHLKNVLKQIVKNSNKHKVQILTKKKEFKFNGDMANMFNDDIDHHEFESDLGFDFNNSKESMEIGNNGLGHY
jgi:hypothetical protein